MYRYVALPLVPHAHKFNNGHILSETWQMLRIFGSRIMNGCRYTQFQIQQNFTY